MKLLADHGSNVYSQAGEAGIIARIFEIIKTRSRLCVEFGAWDGFYLSNTANLWTNGWRGVLIEALDQRFRELQRNVSSYEVRAIQEFVRHQGDNTLERILSREGVTDTPDLLSIDIDGDDFYVFESLQQLRPRVIVCEYNPTIPPHIDLNAEPGNYFGCSALALTRLAETKGYRLVACTDTNLMFVQGGEVHLFQDHDTNLESIFVGKHLNYLITGFAGDYVFSREPPYGFTVPTVQKLRGEFYAVQAKEPPAPALRVVLALTWRRLLRDLRLPYTK